MNTAENLAKQLKNAKRGGYTPTIAKDVNKRKAEVIKQLQEQSQ